MQLSLVVMKKIVIESVAAAATPTPEPQTNQQGEITASMTQIERHSGNYVCSVCGQVFSSQAALDQHKLDNSH